MVNKSELKKDIEKIENLFEVKSYNYFDGEYQEKIEDEIKRQGRILGNHFIFWLYQNDKKYERRNLLKIVSTIDEWIQELKTKETDWGKAYSIVGYVQSEVFGVEF